MSGSSTSCRQGTGAGRRDFSSPQTASVEVKRAALDSGAADVRITAVDPRHVYAGMDLPHRFAITLAVPMAYPEMGHAGQPSRSRGPRSTRREPRVA